ncbi:hypothetical protein FOA52_005281 [Chlamydomonas sp. UWO 241]|nr:hypothetical protein FOA52_005281 [Chlamydomonas sp. UWO 241]
MAPEVYHSQGKASGGYGYPADIWSLGVMLWEVVDGLLPRWAYTSWYWTRLHFPERFSPELRDLLTKMLDKSPKKRLTLRGLKDHPWFASSNFDWDALGAQTMVAPEPKELHNIHIHSSLLPAQFQ